MNKKECFTMTRDERKQIDEEIIDMLKRLKPAEFALAMAKLEQLAAEHEQHSDNAQE